MLGVRPETIRRWERSGKIKTKRTKGGQRMVRPGRLRVSSRGSDRRRHRSERRARATVSPAS
ncbi:MAG: MerR family DNA-binding transcriptional regulator [Actinomycetota bacterium]